MHLDCSYKIPYSGKFLERNISGNLNETVISEIKFQNIAILSYAHHKKCTY